MMWRSLALVVLGACAEHTGPQAAEAAGSAASAASAALTRPGASTSQPMLRLRHSLSRSPENLRFERRAGRLHIDLSGTFQTASVVTLDENGKPQRVCVDDASALDHLLGSHP